MKKTKMEKGITLIALIITIVVLLILAVVSIGAIKNSSIITHAQNASDDYTIAQEKEQLQLALSEWQIQKNTSGNTQTFKDVITSSLNGNATISEKSNELTIQFNKTGNMYKLSNDGTIGESAKLTGTALEKYIFGDDLKGRNFTEIFDINTKKFINTADKDITFNTDIIEDFLGETELLECVYLKYNNENYKFKVLVTLDENNTVVYTTEPYYGLTKIEVVGEKLGKTVSYDGKLWTILYDDGTNGLQMISNEIYEKSEDYFYLGWDDALITDWKALDTTTQEFKLADLNGNKELDDDLEKSIYSYNNAITTLNTACKKMVTENKNIIDVRCVGSNPTNKNAENSTLYTSDKLAKWPEGDSTYSAGIVNGKCKSTDSNYVTDLDRMLLLGIYIIYDNSGDDVEYCLGSRKVYEENEEVRFNIRWVSGEEELAGDDLIQVHNAWSDGSCSLINFRPVVKLKSDVQFKGSGTETDPYTFVE